MDSADNVIDSLLDNPISFKEDKAIIFLDDNNILSSVEFNNVLPELSIAWGLEYVPGNSGVWSSDIAV